MILLKRASSIIAQSCFPLYDYNAATALKQESEVLGVRRNMRIKLINNRFYRIVKASEEEESFAEMALRFRAPNFWFSERYKLGIWDGYISQPFYYKRWKRFASGLLRRMKRSFREAGFPLRVSKPRSTSLPTEVPQDILKGITLRECQIEVIERMVKRKSGVINAATNSGKTEMAIAFTKLSHLRALFIVHSRDALWQTKDRFEKQLDRPVGIWGGGKKVMAGIVIATAATLSANKRDTVKKFRDFEVLFLDECHHLTPKLHALLSKLNFEFGFALSGTPYRKSSQSLQPLHLESLFGSQIAKITNKFLIEKGYSTRPEVIFHDYAAEENDDEEWEIAQEVEIIRNTLRNKLILSIAKTCAKPCVIITTRIEHCGRLYRALSRLSGVTIEKVSGRSPKQLRKSIADRLRKRAVDIVIANIVFDESMDFPDIKNIINAAGGLSGLVVKQRIGRGLRKGEKEKITYHDFIDRGNIYLLKHSLNRMKTLRAEGFLILISDKDGKMRRKQKRSLLV